MEHTFLVNRKNAITVEKCLHIWGVYELNTQVQCKLKVIDTWHLKMNILIHSQMRLQVHQPYSSTATGL